MSDLEDDLLCSHTATPWRAQPRRRASAEMFSRLTGPVSAERAGYGHTPTCRMRFWCSGGGCPPSGDVLLEEARLESRSEPQPPPPERLPSGLLDILSWAESKIYRCGQLKIFMPVQGGCLCGPQSARSSAGPRIILRRLLESVFAKCGGGKNKCSVVSRL